SFPPAPATTELYPLSLHDALPISGIRGIAARVQKAPAYASFTIRKERSNGAETEWAKRLRAITQTESGWLFPSITIHAYVDDFDNGPLIYACIARTKDIFAFADDEYINDAWEPRVNRGDGNSFAVFWVDWLKANGVIVKQFGDINQARGPRRQRIARGAYSSSTETRTRQRG